MGIKWLRTTTMEHKALWRLKNGKKVFVKIFDSSDKNQINKIRGGLGREQTCLEVLQGLAVPELIKLKRSDMPKFPASNRMFIMAQSFAGGKNVHGMKLKSYQLVAAWVFFVEQLAAFRKHKIIYTDFKCGNIMATRNPLRVTIIDFDYAFPLVPGMKKLLCHGFTPGYESPESRLGEIGTESSLVFECAMILFHFLTDRDHRMLNDSKHGMDKALVLLREMNAHGLAKMFQKCLQHKPKNRFKNYEDMWENINVEKLPANIRKTWQQLREPYAERLKELGF